MGGADNAWRDLPAVPAYACWGSQNLSVRNGTCDTDPANTSCKQHLSILHVFEPSRYWPSLALACIALSLYTVASVIVAVLTERRKAHRFLHTVT